MKEKLRINKRGMIIIVVLCIIGFLWYQSGSMFVESTNLESVTINDYTVDNEVKKAEVVELGITMEDVTNTLGANYRKSMYDSARRLYVMTYYDKENNIAMGFVYMDDEENTVAYVVTEKE